MAVRDVRAAYVKVQAALEVIKKGLHDENVKDIRIGTSQAGTALMDLNDKLAELERIVGE